MTDVVDIDPFRGGELQPRPVEVGADLVIAAFAARQHGVVARAQLRHAGISGKETDGRISRGLLHPVYRGVYAVGRRDLSRRGVWSAAVLACGPRAVLSHRSAAALHGLLRARLSSIDVTVPGTGRRAGPGIRIHRTRSLHLANRATVDSIPSTSIPRTLLDLAEVAAPDTLSRAFEEADRLGLLHLHALEKARARAHGRHGLAIFDSVLAEYRAPPDASSELERRFLALCAEDDIPLPSVGILVAGHVVDCLWAAERLVVELDGFVYHRTRAAHERDHQRDIDLALAGFRVLRFSWSQVCRQPRIVVAALRRELVSQARRRGA